MVQVSSAPPKHRFNKDMAGVLGPFSSSVEAYFVSNKDTSLIYLQNTLSPHVNVDHAN